MMKRYPLYLFACLVMSASLLACGDEPAGSGNNGSSEVCETNEDCGAEGAQCYAGACVSSQGGDCEVDLDCENEYEYCGGGTCLLAGCVDDDDCAGNTICEGGRCGQGCRTDAQCSGTEVCDTVTASCFEPGCTPSDCREHEVCDQSLETPECKPDGSCSTELHCTRYERSVEDGINYICSEGTCVEKPPCESDDECAEGEICRADGSCGGGCRNDEQCLLGEYCDEETFTCRDGCDSDADCDEDGICITQEGGESICETRCDDRNICNEALSDDTVGSKVCRDSYCQFCQDDNQCFGIEFCNLEAEGAPEGMGLCQDLPPECPDDGYGDNHSQANAVEITQFPYERTADSDNGIEDLEDGRPLWCKEHSGGEWFSLTADPGKVIVVEIEYDNSAGGNLDLGLVDVNGVDLRTSARPPTEDGGIERLEFGVNPNRSLPLEAAVHVRGSIIDPKVPYTIMIDVRDPESCADDGHEENDVPADATPLPGTPGNGFSDTLPATGLEVCGDDVDWYTVDVPANHILEVTLNAPNRLGDVDIFLYKLEDTTGPNLGSAIEISDSIGDSERLDHTSVEAGTYRVLVDLKQQVGKAIYDIDFKIIPDICFDTAEPNDQCSQATEVVSGDRFVGANSLNVCADNDYYKIVLNPLDKLTVTATYDPAQAAGEMLMTLSGRDRQSPFAIACDNFLVSANEDTVASTGDNRLLIDNYEAELGGEFYILVSRFSGTRVPYELEFDVTSGPECDDDRYDENGSNNDDAANAVALQPGEVINNGPDSAIVGQRICDTNEDWFSITIADGETLTWEIDHDATDGQIDAALIDSDGSSPVVDSNSDPVTIDANGELSVTNSSGADKTYYLKVFGKDGIPVRNGYWLFTYVGGKAPGNGPIDTTCPDVFENNDVDADAAQVAPGSYSNLLICGNDDGGGDWYKTPVEAGQTITVEASFDNPDGNPWLHLFQESDLSSAVVQATASGDTYTAEFTSARDQLIYYRIDTSSSAAGDLYSLDVSIANAPVCSDDGFDGNVDHTTAEPVEAPGLYMRLMNCDDEADWFAVDLNQGESFEAYINYDADRADLDVEIFEQDGTTSVDSGDLSAQIAAVDTATDTYYVRVASADPNVSVRLVYDLLLYRDGNGPDDRLCPDAYEDNDSESSAAAIPAGSYGDLRLCAGNPTDDDYYSVYVPSGATITVDVDFDPAHNVDLFLKNEAGTEVDSSESAVGASTESVTHTNSTSLGAEYTVHVDGGTGTYQTYYSMDVGLAFDPNDPCIEDQFEPNGDMAGAKTPSTGAYDLTLCEGTEDWFEITLADGEELEVNAELRNRLGNIDMELVDTNGDSIPNAAAATSENIESIVYTNSTGASETVYLRVYPKDGAFMRNAYDLWLAIGANLPSTPFCPDDYERNDSTESAPTLDIASQSQFSDMIACGAEDDWYAVQLQDATTYDVDVFFDHSSGFDLDVALVDENGTPVTDEAGDNIEFGTHSGDDDEQTSFTAPSAGTYFLGVRNHGTAADGYRVYFAPQSATCPEDALEYNDNAGSAYTIGPDLPIELNLGACGDEDFYKWVAPADGDVSLTVYVDNTETNLGLRVDEYDPADPNQLPNTIANDQGFTTPTDDNRVEGTFTAQAGFTYIINISRLTLQGESQPSDGAYFMSLE